VGLGVSKEEDGLVVWDKLCKSREVSGFGIINLRLFNVVLLGKWI